MPILSNFPVGSSSGGVALGAVSNISTIVSHGKAYFKWTDPDDIVVDGTALAEFAGTILVRKAGSMPVSRRDGTIVLDSTVRNQYQDAYFCDSGLTDGVTYYYKFFPYTTQSVYTNLDENLVDVTPVAVAPANVSDMSVAAAGNGKVCLKWTDPDNTTEDSITTVAWGGSYVVYKEGSAPTSLNDGTIYANSTTKNQYKSTGLTISGLTNGNTYYFAVFPYGADAYGSAVNTNESNVISGVPNRLMVENVPSQSGSLTYNGDAQWPSWNDWDYTKMNPEETIPQTNAGTYSTTWILNEDYCWSDGTTEPKVVDWTIDKAPCSISLSKTSIILNNDTPSATFTVDRDGDGEIIVAVDAHEVMEAFVNGNEITVNSVIPVYGASDIGVMVAEGTNYLASDWVTCKVVCEFLPPVGTALNDCSWEDIKRISDAGLGSTYFNVGDTKAVTLNGLVGGYCSFNNETYYCQIIGFDHNAAIEGANMIHFQFGVSAASGGVPIAFVDSAYGTSGKYNSFRMNDTDTNSGGWGDSYMRNTVCPAFMAVLPSDLQSVLKTVTKYSDNTGGGSDNPSYVTATRDTVFLLAEYEVLGSTSYANSAEQDYQAQYSYYSSGNSAVRYQYNDTGNSVRWWLRSVYAIGSMHFRIVNVSGKVSNYAASYSHGFAPAFCV